MPNTTQIDLNFPCPVMVIINWPLAGFWVTSTGKFQLRNRNGSIALGDA